MPASGLDPRLTFETFVLGSANRLASAAALRVAEAPGSAYNPLLLYGASGLGKTHLLMAIGNRASHVNPQVVVLYDSLDHLIERGHESVLEGGGGLRDVLRGVQLLLADDMQAVAGRAQAQEELLGAWEAMMLGGGQIVLASDRPPNEIEQLDRRLASRLSGGLVADVAPPDHDARIEIVRRHAAERGQELSDGVARTLADLAFGSVRELHGAVNRVIAAQELEGRIFRVDEAERILGVSSTRGAGEFGSFVSEISGALGQALERLSPEQRLADAILRWEGEGFRTARLEEALAKPMTSAEAKEIVASYEEDIARVRAAEQQIRSLDPLAPELGRGDVLRDPGMVRHAVALVGRVRQRIEHGGAGQARSATGGRLVTLGAVAPSNGASGAASAAHGANEDVAHANTRIKTPSTSGPMSGAQPAATRAPDVSEHPEVVDRWFLSREKVLWDWPYVEDAIASEHQ